MKISLEWLCEYLPGPLDARQLADALTNAGLPVEVIEKVGDDTVIDVEVTSNRGDCLSHIGIAKELSAILDRPFKNLTVSAVESATRTSDATSVEIQALDLCPHYVARVLKGVAIRPSPQWMQRRLMAIGVRPINNVVDVTNYVMFEMGQPLHAFDYDKLDQHRIVVRHANAGEKIVSIDGHERQLQGDMLAIADASRPVALAGVMGGRDSEVSDQTVNILLEAARFDPLSIRKTARFLAMKSDSSYRFERKIDPTLPARASLRACQLILQTAGGELLAGSVEAGCCGYEPKRLTLRYSRLKQVLGVEFSVDEVTSALTRLGLSPVLKGDLFEATAPSHRLDLNIEVDLIEEVVRILGYHRVPVREEISIRLTPPETDAMAMQLIRNSMIAAGYYESITFTWVSDTVKDAFTPPQARCLLRADVRIRKADAHLRPSILPGLLESVARNENVGNGQVKLFETGSVFWADAQGAVVENRRLSLVGSDDLHEVRGTVQSLLAKLDRSKTLRVIPADQPGFAKGASGRLEWDGKTIGAIGEIVPNVAEALGVRSRPCAAELDLVALIDACQHVPQLHSLPRFPAVRRDLSLILGETVKFEQVAALVTELKLQQLETVEYVTTYRGKPLDKGQKSVTITLVFRSPGETLTSEQVEASVQRIIEHAKTTLSATLRS